MNNVSCVTILGKSGTPRSHVFSKNELYVGRSSSNDVRLDPYQDVEVSRRHGILRANAEGQWTYEDLGSTQGSFLKGRKIEGEAMLQNGDTITLGRNGPQLVVTWPQPRVTGAQGTYLRTTPREVPYFPLAFSESFLNNYDTYERIGSGGFGEIWRGTNERNGASHAIKIMHPELLNPEYLREDDRESLIRRFVREAELTHALHISGCPSIVPVHFWGDDPDRDFLFIVMDFVEGESLDKTIFKYDMIPESKACRYLLHLVMGLDYAHTFEWLNEEGGVLKGVVHRDIKPNNILVDAKTDHAWLVDFGIAGIQSGGERLTATSVRVGSHKFLSLEAMEQNIIAPSQDLWAFAVTAYLLFSRGHFPYKGRESLELIKNMRDRNMRPLTEYRMDLSPKLIEFMHRALDVDPKVRPQTAAEWIDLLEPLAEPDPLDAPTNTG